MFQPITMENIEWHIRFMELILIAAASILLYFAIRAHIIGRQLQRFTDDITAQLSGFLATHQHWADVAHIALKTAPDTLEGLLRLLLSLQELTHQISRAGGLARLLSDFSAKPAAPTQQATQDNGRTNSSQADKPPRKARVTRKNQPNGQPENNGQALDLDNEQIDLKEFI